MKNSHGDNMRLWWISDAATEESTRGRLQFGDWQERDVARLAGPCKHDEINGHYVSYVDGAEGIRTLNDLRQAIKYEWCPGAAINEPTIQSSRENSETET